jgi:drug/metabolite transporter (DMT)-like permease
MDRSEFTSKYFIGMLALTPIGGASFPLVKYLLEILSPFHLLSYRLLGGALCLLIIRPKFLFDISSFDLRGGVVTGIFLGSAMSLLTIGLVSTGGGHGAFILSTQVLMIPLIKLLFWREHITLVMKIAIIVTFVGLLVLTVDIDQGIEFNWGELFILFAALSVAFFAVFNSLFSSDPRVNTYCLGFVQILTAGIIVCLLTMTEESSWTVIGSYVYALLILILISTCLRYLLQLKLQNKVSATMTGLIFSLEPIWAVCFCVLFLSEEMKPSDWVGGVLILLGLIIARSPSLNILGFQNRIFRSKF